MRKTEKDAQRISIKDLTPLQRQEIISIRRRLRIVDDKLFSFWFEDTPDTRMVALEFSRLAFPEAEEVTKISSEKTREYSGLEVVRGDLEVRLNTGETVNVEMQKWSFDITRLEMRGWTKNLISEIAVTMREDGRNAAVIVLFDISGGNEKVLGDFPKIRTIRYQAHREIEWIGDEVENPVLDERIFPQDGIGLIILVNLQALGKDKGALGEISRDFYKEGWKDMENTYTKNRSRQIWSDEDTLEELDENIAESVRRFNAEGEAVLKKQIREKDDIIQIQDDVIQQKDFIILEKDTALAEKDKKNIELTMNLISLLKSIGKPQEEVSRISNIPLETVLQYWEEV